MKVESRLAMTDRELRDGERGRLEPAENDAAMARAGQWGHELWTRKRTGSKAHRVVSAERMPDDYGRPTGTVRAACGYTHELFDIWWRRIDEGDRWKLCKRCLGSDRVGSIEELILTAERLGPQVRKVSVESAPVGRGVRLHRFGNRVLDPTFPLDTAWEGAVDLVLRPVDPALADRRLKRLLNGCSECNLDENGEHQKECPLWTAKLPPTDLWVGDV